MPGRSIRIFLIDGTASGLRTAELGLSTIKALVVPRASLSAVTKRYELQKTGVYVLVGTDSDKPGQKKAYIGEGDTILTRLTAHDKDSEKDFWEEAVLLVSKDENLTKAHGRYVESRLIDLARVAKRSTITNGTAPDGQGKLPEADEVEMEEFISQARLLLGALGYDLFEPAPPSPPSSVQASAPAPPTFEYVGEGFNGTCVIDVDAGLFVVKAGSLARINEAPSLQPTYKNFRARLRESGVLINLDDVSYKFTQDYAFSAMTAAAQVVSGITINGRIAWKVRGTTKTFSQWQDEQLSSENQHS